MKAARKQPGTRAIPFAILFLATLHALDAHAEDPPQQAEAAAPPASAAMTMPAMSYPLTANPKPTSFDFGSLGKAYVTGALTAISYGQSNPVAGDRRNRTDIANGQVFIQKTDGVFQYFLQAGAYSMPSLGTPYLTARKTADAYYDVLPQAYVKIAPNAKWSILVGKLPTLVGAEYTFTFENTNVQRGLLWNQENAVNHGAQVSYASGPVSASLAVTDGFYSTHFGWVTGSLAYTFSPADTLSFVAGGNTKTTTVSSSATPLLLNNQQIYNVIYTHTKGAWTLQPYLQYTRVPKSTTLGTLKSASTTGAALLGNYAFSPTFSMAGRAEYIASSGSASDGSPNLLYGPGSKAWSLTLTPTWQVQRLFVRADLAWVKVNSMADGAGFGMDGMKRSQGRVMLETGFLF